MSVNTLLDWLSRLPVGVLALAGLALLVLAAIAPLVAATLSVPLAAGALAVWLVGVAAVFARVTHGRAGAEPRPAAALPAAVPLVLALIAVVVAGQGLGFIPSFSSGTGVAAVGGATATGGSASAATSAAASGSGPAASSANAQSPEPTAASAEPTDLPAPSPTLHHGAVDLQSANITSPVSPGDTVTVTAVTDPWEACSIHVDYPGASDASGLDPTVADGSGTATWTWTVSGDAPSGSWPVRITCANGGWSAWVIRTLVIR